MEKTNNQHNQQHPDMEHTNAHGGHAVEQEHALRTPTGSGTESLAQNM